MIRHRGFCKLLQSVKNLSLSNKSGLRSRLSLKLPGFVVNDLNSLDSYNNALWECADRGKYQLAVDTFHCLQQETNFSPTTKTFRALLRAAGHTLDPNTVMEWFNEAISYVGPDELVYASLFSELGRLQHTKELVSVMIDHMKRADVIPQLKTFQALMFACIRHKSKSQLHTVLEWMAQVRLEPDLKLWTTMLHAFWAVGDMTRARAMCAVARDKGYLAEGHGTSQLYETMLRVYAAAADANQLERVWNEMQEKGLTTLVGYTEYVSGVGQVSRTRLDAEREKLTSGHLEFLQPPLVPEQGDIAQGGQLAHNIQKLYLTFVQRYFSVGDWMPCWQVFDHMLSTSPVSPCRESVRVMIKAREAAQLETGVNSPTVEDVVRDMSELQLVLILQAVGRLQPPLLCEHHRFERHTRRVNQSRNWEKDTSMLWVLCEELVQEQWWPCLTELLCVLEKGAL